MSDKERNPKDIAEMAARITIAAKSGEAICRDDLSEVSMFLIATISAANDIDLFQDSKKSFSFSTPEMTIATLAVFGMLAHSGAIPPFVTGKMAEAAGEVIHMASMAMGEKFKNNKEGNR